MKRILATRFYPLGTGLNPLPHDKLVFTVVKGQTYTWIKGEKDAAFVCGSLTLQDSSSFVAKNTTAIALGKYESLADAPGVILLIGRPPLV